MGYDLIDVRDLDGEALLSSPNLSDNVIPLLTRFADDPILVKRAVEQILAGPPELRDQAVGEL